jgi:putative chitinase
MIFSALLLLGLAAFALVKGVSVLAQDGTTNGGQPRQTVEAQVGDSAARQVVSAPEAGAAVQVEQATPLPPAGASYHTVQSGESLGKIASKYGVTTAALANANGITNPDVIRVGQKLVVPAR